jgi:hypothetical protein
MSTAAPDGNSQKSLQVEQDPLRRMMGAALGRRSVDSYVVEHRKLTRSIPLRVKLQIEPDILPSSV